MSSKVYFMSDRAQTMETGLLAKMLTVFDSAGFDKMISPGDIVAIKVKCGDYNNTGYLQPVYARALADRVKELGGRPFVCDTTSLPNLPSSSRCTALDVLLTAERNGYNSGTLGCPLIIADGFWGTDEVRVDIPDGFICKEAYVAKALAMADVLITITHFTGHPMTVLGGTIEHLGNGCQSKRGKLNVRMAGHPRYGMVNAPIFNHLCLGQECPTWYVCGNVCPYGLIKFDDKNGKLIFNWDQKKCSSCFACMFITLNCEVVGMPDDTLEAQSSAMADGALGVLKTVDKEKCGFINMVIDVSPWGDDFPWSDRALVPDVGVFASKDAVAIDMASLDKCEELAGMSGSVAEERAVAIPGTKGRFSASSSLLGVSEMCQINAGVKNGLGTKEYELIGVTPASPAQFLYQWDKRLIGDRLRKLVTKDPVFPFDKGFKRLDETDFSEVR